MEIEEDDSIFEVLANTVKLNIGGYKYEALKETLTKNESFFSLMINSPISSKTDSDGYIYIEQDGEVFKYILEYLKTGEITFYNHEEKLNFIKKISKENEFYQIPDIEDYVYALNGKSVKDDDCKTFNQWLENYFPEWKYIREQENKYRKTGNLDDIDVVDVYQNRREFIKENIFDNIGGEYYVDYNRKECCNYITNKYSINKSFINIEPTLDKFKMNFNALTMDLFEDFNWEGVVVAGGAVFQCLNIFSGVNKFTNEYALKEFYNEISYNLNHIYQNRQYWNNEDVDKYKFYEKTTNETRNNKDINGDIDVFIIADTDEEATEIVKRSIRKLNQNYYKQITMGQYINSNEEHLAPLIVTNRNTTSFVAAHPFRNIQFITSRRYNNPVQVISGFDIDSCTFYYDGSDVYTIPRGVRSMKYSINLIDPERQSFSYHHRLMKYARRGMLIIVPGLKYSKLDYRISSLEYSETEGLSRLIWLTTKYGKYNKTFITRSIIQDFQVFMGEIMKNTTDRISRITESMLNNRFINHYDGYRGIFRNKMSIINQVIDYESSENKNICDYSSDYCEYNQGTYLHHVKYKYWKQLSSWKSANYGLFRESRDHEEKSWNEVEIPLDIPRVCSTTFLETTEGHRTENSSVYTLNIFEHFKFNWESINPGTQIIDGRFNPEDVDYYKQAFEYDKWVQEKMTLVTVSDSTHTTNNS